LKRSLKFQSSFSWTKFMYLSYDVTHELKKLFTKKVKKFFKNKNFIFGREKIYLKIKNVFQF
jgi:hypothetical protein